MVASRPAKPKDICLPSLRSCTVAIALRPACPARSDAGENSICWVFPLLQSFSACSCIRPCSGCRRPLASIKIVAAAQIVSIAYKHATQRAEAPQKEAYRDRRRSRAQSMILLLLAAEKCKRDAKKQRQQASTPIMSRNGIWYLFIRIIFSGKKKGYLIRARTRI